MSLFDQKKIPQEHYQNIYEAAEKEVSQKYMDRIRALETMVEHLEIYKLIYDKLTIKAELK